MLQEQITDTISRLGGEYVACLPLDSRFQRSNPAEAKTYREIKIRSMTSEGNKVIGSLSQDLTACRKLLRRMNKDKAKAKFIILFGKFLLICY